MFIRVGIIGGGVGDGAATTSVLCVGVATDFVS